MSLIGDTHNQMIWEKHEQSIRVFYSFERNIQ